MSSQVAQLFLIDAESGRWYVIAEDYVDAITSFSSFHEDGEIGPGDSPEILSCTLVDQNDLVVSERVGVAKYGRFGRLETR